MAAVDDDLSILEWSVAPIEVVCLLGVSQSLVLVEEGRRDERDGGRDRRDYQPENRRNNRKTKAVRLIYPQIVGKCTMPVERGIMSEGAHSVNSRISVP